LPLNGFQIRGVQLEFDAPLTVSEVAVLAVQNNPDLRAVRQQHGVAQAQLLQAGLLPNPQVTGAMLPLVAGLGTTTAWNAGISEDIRSLITLSTRRRSARESARQVDAQIVWPGVAGNRPRTTIGRGPDRG